MTTPASPTATGSAVCPICRRPTETRYRPFCSARCADVDLGHWFSESYRVPAVEKDEDLRERDDTLG